VIPVLAGVACPPGRLRPLGPQAVELGARVVGGRNLTIEGAGPASAGPAPRGASWRARSGGRVLVGAFWWARSGGRLAQVAVQVSFGVVALPLAWNPKVVVPLAPIEPFHPASVATTSAVFCFSVVFHALVIA
jgi:hypothetical protein